MAAITVHQEPHVLMYQAHFNVPVNLDTLEMEIYCNGRLSDIPNFKVILINK